MHLFNQSTFLALIVCRILKVRSNHEKGRLFDLTLPLTKIVWVYVIYGLCYTLVIFLLLGLYLRSNNGQYTVSHAVCLHPSIASKLI
jgi:hypothetical protein